MAKKLIEKGLSVHPTSIKILKAYLDQLVQYGSLDLTEIIDIYHDYLNKTNHSSRFFKPAFATLADKFERSKIIDLLVKS
ncbi:hypothetical protein HZS_6262 [Henneguya salminicola]|nr:hypothetical protein HZS_6262 [Henneguya salminicola]